MLSPFGRMKTEALLRISTSPLEKLQELDGTRLEELVRDIIQNGLKTPLLVDVDQNILFNGHHRLIAAMRLGLTELPVKFSHGIKYRY